MEYLTNEQLIDWANKHCIPKDKLDVDKAVVEAEVFGFMLNKIDGLDVTSEPITFNLEEFSNILTFSLALSRVSEYYKHSEDIMVRYVKKEDKETKKVNIFFQVLKSKAKLFSKYLKESGDKIVLTVSSNKDIKSCIKYLNSLGVKGDDGESISSKETDYAKDIKDSLINGKAAYIEIEYNDEYACPILEWWVIDDNGEFDTFPIVKENTFDKIIKNS